MTLLYSSTEQNLKKIEQAINMERDKKIELQWKGLIVAKGKTEQLDCKVLLQNCKFYSLLWRPFATVIGIQKNQEKSQRTLTDFGHKRLAENKEMVRAKNIVYTTIKLFEK